MLVPISWLREFVELPAQAQAVAEMLAQIGFPVDSISERPVITGVVVARIEELEKHPNADRLQVGRINAGNGSLLTIATAATNVAAGQTIAVALIGAQLPQLKIERRKMRGIESEGMMISAGELALPEEWFEDGIMQLGSDAVPGTDAVEYFGLRDAVLDVEITSNRVDAMSIAGLARELAAFQGVPLRLPPQAQLQPGGSGVRVSIETADCERLIGARIEGVQVTASPAWMRVRLALAGQRPINNLVDISNYVMLETGQPLHFYDAAKVPGGHLIVRDAREHEKLTTLDGTDRALTAADLVIATADGPAGLAGLMGGAHTEVSESTQSLLLESATFAGPRVRRMSARHNLRTEASTRNEKGLAAALALTGAQRAIALLEQRDAQVTGAVIAGDDPKPAEAITFPLGDIERLLGLRLDVQNVRDYLDRLGFALEASSSETLLVTPPAWRRDVTMSADLVEEVARMAGYDRIEPLMPAVPAHDIGSDAYTLESLVAQTLAALGYHEIMTVAMHGASVLEKLQAAGFEPSATPVEVLNPLSEEQRYLRFALGPAHLQYFARIDRPVRTFEIAHIFAQEEGGPSESAILTFGFSAEPLDEPPWRDSHFLQIKRDAESLLRVLTGCTNIEWTADRRSGAHPGKTAAGLIDGREIAFICQVDPRLQKAFGVRLPAYGCWVYFERITEYEAPRYVPPSKYPGTYRDLALLCPVSLSAASVERAIAQAVGGLCTGVRAFDEYRGPQVPSDKKSLAVRVTLVRNDATITDEQADEAIERALEALRAELGVTLRA